MRKAAVNLLSADDGGAVMHPRAVECRACNAQPGEPCSAPTDTGRRSVTWHHFIRENDAMRTGLEPTDDYWDRRLMDAYGKTSQELANEAERGYDPSRIKPIKRTSR